MNIRARKMRFLTAASASGEVAVARRRPSSALSKLQPSACGRRSDPAALVAGRGRRRDQPWRGGRDWRRTPPDAGAVSRVRGNRRGRPRSGSGLRGGERGLGWLRMRTARRRRESPRKASFEGFGDLVAEFSQPPMDRMCGPCLCPATVAQIPKTGRNTVGVPLQVRRSAH